MITMASRLCGIASQLRREGELKKGKRKLKRLNYERWVYFNPDTGVFIETMPSDRIGTGMSGGYSLARAFMFLHEEEAVSWIEDVHYVNPAFKVTRVTLEAWR